MDPDLTPGNKASDAAPQEEKSVSGDPPGYKEAATVTVTDPDAGIVRDVQEMKEDVGGRARCGDCA